jgi:hypothetical protein
MATMTDKSVRAMPDPNHDEVRTEAEQGQERGWRAGLIAALVFFALAVLCNAIAYHKLARLQEQGLGLSLAQSDRPGMGAIKPP